MMDTKKFPSQKEILMLLAAGAFLVASIVMPGLPKVAKLFLPEKPWGSYPRGRLKRTVKKLIDKKLVSIREEDEETVIKLTRKGEEQILRYKIDDMKLQRPKNWDGKWRIVIFDIPNTKKVAREIFRNKLKELGFFRLQESVFLTPYKCENEIEFLRHVLEIDNFVVMITASKIENADYFKDYFQV